MFCDPDMDRTGQLHPFAYRTAAWWAALRTKYALGSRAHRLEGRTTETIHE